VKCGLIFVKRYLSVRLLLFRPFLPQVHYQKADNASSVNLYSEDQIIGTVVFQCQIQCVKAAEDMIEFIIRNLPEQTQAHILPSNWYTVSCKLLCKMRDHGVANDDEIYTLR
jgi:hypothetical protein